MARKRNKSGRFTKKTRSGGSRKKSSSAGKKRSRRRSSPIRGITPMRRKSNGGGGRMSWADAAMSVLANGGGQLGAMALDTQLLKMEKLPEPLKDGKIRGGAIALLGVAGARYANKSLRQVALGAGGMGLVIAAKEMLPSGFINGIGRDELSPAEADLIESLALNGLEDDLDDTLKGDMDQDVSDTVTGDDDDDDGGDDDTVGDDDDDVTD